MADIRVFGEYFLGKRIATGGTSELFRARRVGLSGFERLLAIKTILPHYAEHPEFVTMFINEAKLASRLHHSNIVQILDLGLVEDTYFIAMEYVFGRSLAQLMNVAQDRQVHPSIENVVTLISRVATALDYAHRLTDNHGRPVGLVHRDVSPHNILVSFEGEVKLVDFGIAKATSPAAATRVGVLKGKIAYMSPQQAGGEPVDNRSDIYSLGIVFHELLCRQKLFTGESEMTILQKVVRPDIRPPSVLNQFIPAALDPIVMRALAPKVEDRYQKAGDLAADLEAFLHSQGAVPSTFDLRQLTRAAFADRMAAEQKEIQAEERSMAALARTGADAAGDPDSRTRVLPPAKEEGPPSEPEPVAVAEPTPGEGRRRAFLAALIALLSAGLIALVLYLHLGRIITPPRPGPDVAGPWHQTARDYQALAARWGVLAPTVARPRLPKPGAPSLAEVWGAFGADVLDQAVLEVLWPPAEQFQPLRLLLGPMLVWANYREGRRSIRFTYFRREALVYLKRAVELDRRLPRRYRVPSLYLALGRLYTEESEFRRAQDAYQHLLALDPRHAIGRFNLGFVLLRTGQYARAVEEYRRLEAQRPPFLDDVLINLGVAYYNLEATGKKGRPPFRPALEAFERALWLNKYNMMARHYIIRLRLIITSPVNVRPKAYWDITVKPDQIVRGKTLLLMALWHTRRWENWKVIALENQLAYPYHLHPGQTLRFPRAIVERMQPLTKRFAQQHQADVPDKLNPLPPHSVTSRPSLDHVYQFPPVAPK
ncbi:MAG: protein kinase [Proteobacteria bacterium]|nr:protein kinase [Pseudomonadota bacterium]